jgi:archaellum component FlaC
MTDAEKLDAILTLLPGMAAEVKGIGAGLAGMREELTGMRVELKRIADAAEVVAVEQARLREAFSLRETVWTTTQARPTS